MVNFDRFQSFSSSSAPTPCRPSTLESSATGRTVNVYSHLYYGARASKPTNVGRANKMQVSVMLMALVVPFPQFPIAVSALMMMMMPYDNNNNNTQ